MTPLSVKRDDLSLLENRLYRQLLAMSLVSAVAGWGIGGTAWAVSAALGPLAAIGYFGLLAAHTRRVLASGRVPSAGLLSVSLAGRQAFCLAAPAACWYAWGEPWLVCLATLLVARHWIVVVARPSALPSAA
jgi:hypothetical protein